MSKDNLDAVRLIRDLLFHESDRVSQRTDWFLVSQAILVEASGALGDSADQPGLSATVGLLGLLLAAMWFATGVRAKWVADHLGALLAMPEVAGQQFANVFRTIYEVRDRHAPATWARPTPVFCVVVPLLCVVTWVALLAFSLEPAHWPIVAAVAVAGFGVPWFVLSRHDGTPRLPPEAVQRVVEALRSATPGRPGAPPA